MQYSVKFEGLPELQRRLNAVFTKFPKERANFLRREAELLKGRVKLLTPVDTGFLRNSWERTEPAGDSIEVYDNAEYANFVETGHRIVYRNRRGEKIYTGRRVEGVFFLRDAVDETQAQYNVDAQKFLARLLK